MSGNKFSMVKRGYDPEEVDNYIETLESVLKSYKEKDTAIKNAIVNAQIAADNIIKTAEMQADDLKANAIEQMGSFSTTISTQKALIKDFIDDYNVLVNKYVKDFNENEFNDLYENLVRLEEYFTALRTPVYRKRQEVLEDE